MGDAAQDVAALRCGHQRLAGVARDDVVGRRIGRNSGAAYWGERFDRTYAGEADTWDYQWFFNCWAQNGLAVVPGSNLVTNIGFGEDATHTKAAVDTMSYLPTEPMTFPAAPPGDNGPEPRGRSARLQANVSSG